MELSRLSNEYRVWAEIDTAQWRRNFAAMAEHVAPAEMLPVLKSDGYGLGARQATEAYKQAGARRVAVAALSEAKEISDLGVEVQFLGKPVSEELSGIVEVDGVGSVPDLETAVALNEAAKEQERLLRVHFLVDTGMGRMGTFVPDVLETLDSIEKLSNICLEGIYSHLPASEKHDAETYKQIETFQNLIEDLAEEGFRFRYRHLANSCAVAGLNAAVTEPFNMVRPGIDLHGVCPNEVSRPYSVRPVFVLKTRLVAVRRMPVGFTVGYGRRYAVSESEPIGTVAIGYADGYPQRLTNNGYMLVRGKRAPVVGSVCMDYCQLSLADVPDAEPGDEVVVIGTQDAEEITTAEVADWAGTIEYEILCRLGRRVFKKYT